MPILKRDLEIVYHNWVLKRIKGKIKTSLSGLNDNSQAKVFRHNFRLVNFRLINFRLINLRLINFSHELRIKKVPHIDKIYVYININYYVGLLISLYFWLLKICKHYSTVS